MNMCVSKLQEIVKDREAQHTAVHGIAKSPHTAQLGLLDQGLFTCLRNHTNDKV